MAAVSNPLPIHSVRNAEPQVHDPAKADELPQRIARVRAELTNLEARVHGADPALRVYENYRDIPDEWMTKRGFYADCGMWGSGTDRPSVDEATRKKRQIGLEKLEELVKPMLLHELASNGFETLVVNGLSPEWFAQCVPFVDRLVGMQPSQDASPTARSASAEEMLDYLATRHQALVDTAERVCREYEVQEQVYLGLRDSTIASQLKYFVDGYVWEHTPQELRGLRRTLDLLENQQAEADRVRKAQNAPADSERNP